MYFKHKICTVILSSENKCVRMDTILKFRNLQKSKRAKSVFNWREALKSLLAEQLMCTRGARRKLVFFKSKYRDD